MAAVLDRVLHHSHTLLIQGGSYRLKQKKRVALLGSTKTNHCPWVGGSLGDATGVSIGGATP